jgi:hypothetical protein
LYDEHPCFSISSDDDDELPLAKRAKLFSGRAESAKESNPSPAKPTPPLRTTVGKVPVSKVISPGSAPVPSTVRDHVNRSSKLVFFFCGEFSCLAKVP